MGWSTPYDRPTLVIPNLAFTRHHPHHLRLSNDKPTMHGVTNPMCANASPQRAHIGMDWCHRSQYQGSIGHARSILNPTSDWLLGGGTIQGCKSNIFDRKGHSESDKSIVSMCTHVSPEKWPEAAAATAGRIRLPTPRWCAMVERPSMPSTMLAACRDVGGSPMAHTCCPPKADY